VPEYYVRRCAEVLRRDGSVIAPLATAAERQEWRAGIRRVCRVAGLRVRTGLSADGEVAWAYHADHVVTEASSRAASRAIEACTAPKRRNQPDLRVHGVAYAARWYSLITPPSTFRRRTGASSGTTTGSS
jgi:hypothetical protein